MNGNRLCVSAVLLAATVCGELQLRKINIVVVTDAHSWLSGHR